ncbi:MAG: hypothetical protein JNL54_01450 [Kineosporiaceae bacterium]|nr:hypothetical protein [Kineosporiaceae bacterium]
MPDQGEATPSVLTEAADQLVRLLLAAPEVAPGLVPGRRVLAVEGRSGAGKSAIARIVHDRLTAEGWPVTAVSMDELYPGWDGLEAGVDLLLDGVLVPFTRGAPEVLVRRWDWQGGRPGAVEHRAAGRLLVVEGVGCGARRCAPHLSVLAWLEAPDAARKARALARDGRAYAPHWDRWAAQEVEHYDRQRTRERSDTILVLP